jgi:O-antigen biosynthesis protein
MEPECRATAGPLTLAVAICTMDRPESLRRCLCSLAPYRSLVAELIVVDESRFTKGTRDLALLFGTIYVRESRCGVSIARNRAIEAAGTDLIAFIDDDCEVSEGWLRAIFDSFAEPEVGCVTGPAVSPPDANHAQKTFDSYPARRWSTQPFQILPDALGHIYYGAVAGIGANMAFRLAVLRQIGGFHEMLNGGDDDYIFYMTVKYGYKIQYTPAGLVYQHHRETHWRNVRRLYYYGYSSTHTVVAISFKLRSAFLLILNLGFLLRTSATATLQYTRAGALVYSLFESSFLLGIVCGILLIPITAIKASLWNSRSGLKSALR